MVVKGGSAAMSLVTLKVLMSMMKASNQPMNCYA